MEENTVGAAQNLLLESRGRLRLTGVTDVHSFDDSAVVVETVLGELTVTGSSLHIGALNTETGELQMEGTVDAMIYAESTHKSGGFFARVFR